MVEPLIKTLLEAGVHFGHQTRRWNPKMKRYIFGEKNGIYLLDLEKTAQGITEAQAFLRSLAAQGGAILFVGTKRQAQPIVAEETARCNQFYVNLRWLGGLLTNFQTIRRSVERLKTLRAWREDGTLSRLKKKEAAQREHELAKLEKTMTGIIEMDRLPKALVVVDAKREETAIREANRLGIPVVALVDTDSDPDSVSYVIPGNDDAIRSIKLTLSLLADAILEGHHIWLTSQPAPPAPVVTPEETVSEELPSPTPAPVEEEVSAPTGEPVPQIDEVEAIVPETVLKVEESVVTPPKKKRVVKPKANPKGKEKE